MEMKYLKKEYCWSADEEDYEELDHKWLEGWVKYHAYLDTVKDKLSKTFRNLYFSDKGLHDADINNISIKDIGKNRCDVSIELSALDGKNYHLLYKGVVQYKADIPEKKNWMGGVMMWAFDELELRKDGLWIHRLLLDPDCTMELVYKRIVLKEIK